MHAWYPGQNGNQAVAEAVFGDLNPSGHLPDTFEKRWEDSPSFASYPGDAANGGTVKYDEGIFVGYRWYDRKNIAPRYPFGYGLSYTKFAIDDLHIVKPAGESSNGEWHVTAKVTNTGSVPGACVSQLYVRPVGSSIDRPVQELKGFSRTELQPGANKVVDFVLKRDAFATYDESKHAWIYPAGQYEIALGTSSRDIHCSNTLSFEP
jgi:beta-glucosidase